MSVRYGILGLLAQQPRHGYELHAAFVALVGGKENWDLRASQVYGTLERLVDAGLVSEAAVEKGGGPEKHVLEITPAGKAELLEWFRSPSLTEHLHDEVFVKLMLSLPLGAALTREVIHAQRAALYRELHRVTAMRQRTERGTELAFVLLFEKSVMHLEADLRWLDMVEARLDDVERQPLPQPLPKPRGRPPKARTAGS